MAVNASRRNAPLFGSEMWSRVLAARANTSATLLSFHAYGERFTFGHAGSLGTTSSNLLSFPEWRISVAIHTNASADEFRDRGIKLVQDAVRRRLARQYPPPPCTMKLTRVSTVDNSWQNDIVPNRTDDRIRIRVDFTIEANPRTGDVQFSVQLGDKAIQYDYFRGLQAGIHHTLHFEFDVPKIGAPKVTVILDSLGTAGNTTPEAARFQHVLMLEG